MNTQDKHFHMSDEYEIHSSSQKSVGRKVIETAVRLAKSTLVNPSGIRALDIACGPGNLTIELLHSLEHHFPGVKIELTGLDYSESNVKRLIVNSGDRIKGITASFYKLPEETRGQNLITSNEGLHWQPPYKMNQIYNDLMPTAEKEKYQTWALKNLSCVFKNIFESLHDDGIAVLQFGHEGQLKNLWGLIYSLFHDAAFKEYIPKINFPVYHPSIDNIHSALKRAGFPGRITEIIAYEEDFSEDSPLAITNFFKAVSKPGFSQFMNSDTLKSFYNKMEEKLQNIDLKEFRKNQWHRTIIKLKKT
jgi:SAM-dependent methyltransferase